MKKIIEDKYFKLGLTVFLIIVSCITFYFIVEKVNYIILGFKWIIKIFTPFIIGFTFAYLLNPLVIFFEDLFKNLFLNKSKLKSNPTQDQSFFKYYYYMYSNYWINSSII